MNENGNDDPGDPTNNDNGAEPPGDGDGGSLDPDAPPVTEGDWYRPTVDATWQWQLQPDAEGAITTSYDVEMYDIDLFDVSADSIAALQADGRRVICYFSAGTFEDFREDADAFAAADLGTTLDDFADERWLDIRSAGVHAVMLARLDLAVEKGCDGVEPDNVTGFQNETGFDLTAADQLAFNRFIANEAHRRNLAVGLKNDLEQIDALLDYFDFAVNEQCHEFDECEVYDAFVEAGKAVFSAEYADVFVEDADQRNAMCAAALDRGLRTLILPVDLDDAFRFSCD
ncbi:MAG: endo alpha-1,4 polygalactosaminidase [bacterium]|nr:endo alpha-1,4 polygalactosaminidase [bacterium]